MAITFDVTPANGGANAIATLEKTSTIDPYEVVVRSTSDGSNTAVNLATNDGLNGSIYDQILREFNPLMAYAPVAGSNNVIYMILEINGEDVSSCLQRLARIDGVGSDSTFRLGSSFSVTV